VVVERPVAQVLAATWQARDARFLVLLVSIGLAAGGGVLVAGRLIAPLAEQRANAEVRALNTGLEQRVADRTADLQVAIENLHAQISQRTLAEAALRESEERYRVLVEQSPEPIVVYAEDHFVYVNPAAVRLFGARTAAQLIGLPAAERIHPESRAAVNRRAAAIRDGIMGREATHAIELRIVRLDGSTVDVETTAAGVAFDGRPAIQVIVRDVSERKAIERMKDEFISMVSHELRTPLTSIRGSLGLLASGVLGPLAGQGQRMLDIAVGNTDRLIRLLNDVLDLERMRFGQVTLQRSHCTAAELLGRAMSEMRGMADAAAVELVLSTASGKVDADPDRLVQVLTNLVSNAIKFSPPGVRVWLSATASGPNVRFSVRDEGRGIPPEKLETIFERFSQVDASDSREKGGTGLGLAICRTIVEAHAGRIWAESVSGQGSSFVFELPRVESSAQAA
jgi:PAS domain S-box-containing protein